MFFFRFILHLVNVKRGRVVLSDIYRSIHIHHVLTYFRSTAYILFYYTIYDDVFVFYSSRGVCCLLFERVPCVSLMIMLSAISLAW